MIKGLLIDLPTSPKGTISLSLFNVASCISDVCEVTYLDLNFENDSKTLKISDFSSFGFAGLKVSSQNFQIAQELTRKLKSKHKLKIVWGGELPTLLPEECLKYADTIINGLFEPVAEQFSHDLANNSLKQHYKGDNLPVSNLKPPFLSLITDFERYNTFMGLPLETSRGCPENCTFCMVLTMQRKNYYLKNIEQLSKEIDSYHNRFINIIDYNFGVDSEHVIRVSSVIEKSTALGWMAEMNIELLDNDAMLQAMANSRCKMIYCGLESIDEKALESVNKARVNVVENYRRIIKKAQSYGINVAAGLILGLEGMNEDLTKRTFQFYSEVGIIYTKLTFLTFNPGTRVKDFMSKKGVFVTEEIEKYDGIHLTYLAPGMNEKEIYSVGRWYILNFYSIKNIVSRSLKTPISLKKKIEFILFNICYRAAYLDWLKYDIFEKEENFTRMLTSHYSKPIKLKLAEKMLNYIRKSYL